ncbi:MAG: FAD-dependent monooxygenase [Phycisphaerales bacterium]|nr:FAD-dependent monooxygenase [Phycisphaerales bacterium]
MNSPSTLIIGAGLAGSLLAIYLARRGHKVALYERRPDPRQAGYIGGRSINLALSARGLWGMAGVGITDEILAHAIPMRGRCLHSPIGDLAFQPYSKNPTDAINSISRGGLNLALLHAAAREPNVSFHFNHRCLDVDLTRNAAALIHETPGGTGRAITVEADLICGADGAFSPVRGAMQKTDRFDYSQSYLEHGYKELHIPAVASASLPMSDPTGSTPGGSLQTARAAKGESHIGKDADATRFALDPNALHIWPRGGAMMIALPNPDGSFTCTLFWPFDGPHGLNALTTRGQVLAFFTQHYPDAVPLMPTLADDFLRNPSSSLVTVRCKPWFHFAPGGRAAVLLGDAAHAIVPFYGQGMNCAFEDCRVLAETLDAHGHDFAAALPAYQAARKPNADAIADMALENFIEMRDKVGSKDFLHRKRLEHALHQIDPANLTPQYHLVSFSTVPYAEAQRQGRRIDALLDRFTAAFPRAEGEGLDTPEFVARVRARLGGLLAS